MSKRVIHGSLASVHLSIVIILGSLPSSFAGIGLIVLNSVFFAVNLGFTFDPYLK